MFVKAIRVAQDVMFPIFGWNQISPTEAQVGVAGTGFFVSSEGHFVSVAHVFDTGNTTTKFLYIGRLPEEVHTRLEIQEIARDDENDVFLGKVDVKGVPYVIVDSLVPDVGRSVCIGGYPLATISTNENGGLQLGGVRRYFQPSFVLDKAGELLSKGPTGKIRKHNGYPVRDAGLYGMSGGPVFDADGNVVGVQGSIISRDSKNAVGQSIAVHNAFSLQMNKFVDLMRKHGVGNNRVVDAGSLEPISSE